MDCASCQCCERSIAKICRLDFDWIAIRILFLSLLLLLLLIFFFLSLNRDEPRFVNPCVRGVHGDRYRLCFAKYKIYYRWIGYFEII